MRKNIWYSLSFLFKLKNDTNLNVYLDSQFFYFRGMRKNIFLVGWEKLYNILCLFLFKLKNDNNPNVKLGKIYNNLCLFLFKLKNYNNLNVKLDS